MRANQRNLAVMNLKKDRTPEEEEERKAYLKNARSFEREIDEEIARVQAILIEHPEL